MNMKNRILLIDEDLEFAKRLGKFLINECFDVDIYDDEVKGKFAAQNIQYDIILLDIVASKFDGFELLKRLREKSLCPIVVITEIDDQFDHVYSLEIGADDYLLKSIHQRLLKARINSIIRRSYNKKTNKSDDLLCVNNISLCQTMRKSYYNDKVLDLTGGEFNVLYYLMSNAGKVVSKESISKNALGRKTSYYDRCIDMHISNIRRKISLISSNSESTKIKTVRGSGYIFLLPPRCDISSPNKKKTLNTNFTCLINSTEVMSCPL